MDLIVDGKRFGSDKAHREAAYCLPLVTAHLERLQTQGIETALPLELRGHDEALTTHDRALAEAQKRQEKDTDAMAKLLSSSVDLVARAWTYAVKAFKTGDAAALESFPSRTGVHQSVDRMVVCLNGLAGFLTTHEAAMATAGSPPGLAREATERAEALLEVNRVQEAAKQATEARALAVYLARGEIYRICGLVYLAGRAEFRRSPELRAKFCYQHMTRNGRGTTAGSSTASTGSTDAGTGATAEPSTTTAATP